MRQLDPGDGPDRSVADMLGHARGTPGVLDLACAYLTGFHALDPGRASARGIFREESGASGAERMVRIVEGQDRIVAGLVRGGIDVRMRTTRIGWWCTLVGLWVRRSRSRRRPR
jgi:hypothetical protein